MNYLLTIPLSYRNVRPRTQAMKNQTMRVSLALCAASLLLTGCATLLTPENSVRSDYSSPRSSEQVYRNLLKVARECYPTGVSVEANYFPEAKEGEITLAPTTDMSRFEWARLSVAPTPGGASVHLQRNARFSRFEAVVPDWIEGRAPVCPHGTRYEKPKDQHQP